MNTDLKPWLSIFSSEFLSFKTTKPLFHFGHAIARFVAWLKKQYGNGFARIVLANLANYESTKPKAKVIGYHKLLLPDSLESN